MKFIIFFIYFFNYVFGDMTNNIRNIMLDLHNDIRNYKTIVPATNMIKLAWDNTLEREAFLLANSCIFEHNNNISYGQNIYKINNLDLTFAINNSIDSWYNEINDFSLQIINNLTLSNKVGIGIYNHVSQLLWALTSLVGCSYNFCNFGIFIVCNYLNPGNEINQEWFISGKPCSLCNFNYPYCNNNLCTTINKINNNKSTCFN